MGQVVVFPNGTQYSRSAGYGTSAFITYGRLRSRDFLKGDDAFILLTVEGMSIKIVLVKLFLLLVQLVIVYCVLLAFIFRYIIKDVGRNRHE